MSVKRWLAGVLSLGAVTLAACAADEGYQAPRLATPPVIDGRMDEWTRFVSIPMKQPNVPDLKVETACLGWDATNLYLAVDVRDKAIVNSRPLPTLQDADAVDFRLLAADGTGGSNLWRFCLAPSCATGQTALRIDRRDLRTGLSTQLVAATANQPAGVVTWAVATNAHGWAVEAAVPVTLLGLRASSGVSIPLLLVVWDRDRTDVDEWKEWHKRSENASQKAAPEGWPRATLSEPVMRWVPPAGKSGKAASPAVTLERHRPCNLFDPAEPVRLNVGLTAFPAGTGEAEAILTDAWGKERLRRTHSFAVPSATGPVVLDLGKPGCGYYELRLKVTVRTPEGAVADASGTATLGVATFVSRTAAEVREQGCRFGLKWWGGVTDKPETLEMMARLGLQWTRVGQGEAAWAATNAPLNTVVKIERFPKELYDEGRYGDLASWEAKYGKGAWTLKTLPRKADYQVWLAGSLATIPKDQTVFEIWNEPWDKMSAEDFATLSGWIAEVVKRERPAAILGQNLRGDMSDFGYDARVAKAGGLRDMSMVCLHPYAASEDRDWLRAYRDWISRLAGRPMAVYVTEYGTHSTPSGPAKRSEMEQARAVVRQSLALYAEDVKALIPHWVGQSERNPTYIEDWFGFIRRNQEPKPVLLAHATSARLVDASRYVGDLWYGPGIGAMLFEKGGTRTLALWTQGVETNVTIDAGAPQIVLTDMFGGAQTRETDAGKLRLDVGSDMLYVTGISAAAAAQASTALRADRWPQPAKPPRNVRTIHKLAKPPVCDGRLDDWAGATQVALLNPKVNGDDASGMASLAWDDTCLYVALAVRDNEVLNNKPSAKLYLQDSLELFLSTQARDANPGYGPTDHQFFITPTSGEGRPIIAELADREAGKLKEIPGLKGFAGKAGAGWVAEVAIPWASLPEARPGAGARMALEMRLNDADTSHERWKLDPIDGNVRTEDPTAWSLLLLAE